MFTFIMNGKVFPVLVDSFLKVLGHIFAKWCQYRFQVASLMISIHYDHWALSLNVTKYKPIDNIPLWSNSIYKNVETAFKEKLHLWKVFFLDSIEQTLLFGLMFDGYNFQSSILVIIVILYHGKVIIIHVWLVIFACLSELQRGGLVLAILFLIILE